MSRCLLLLIFVAFICKVHSQLCSPPILPPPCPPPCVPISCPTIPPCPVTSPQVINPNPYVTTIIDTSVSNSLVNALQLLIVSNLIGSTIGPSAPLLNNLGPLLDSLVCSKPCSVELIGSEYIIPPYTPIPSCGSIVDLLPPVSLISPCGPYVDYIPPYTPIPNCGPYYDYIPPCGPTTYPSYDLIPPCGPVMDPYLPLCGFNDVYPNYITYTETITPFCINTFPNGYGDLLFPLPGIDTVCPSLCNGLTEIIPNCINYPIPEICPINPYYGGFAEPLTPALPNMFGCVNELPPYGPMVVPNYYGGLPELSSPAEVIFPSPIPVPPNNYGYSPASLPCVRILDPLVNDNCVYGGFGAPIYY